MSDPCAQWYEWLKTVLCETDLRRLERRYPTMCDKPEVIIEFNEGLCPACFHIVSTMPEEELDSKLLGKNC